MASARSAPKSEVWTYAALALVVVVAYSRVARAGLVWDDSSHVIGAGLASLRGLGRIWAQPGATQQYYPVTYTAFWLQWHLWRGSPIGYHVVNVLLHAGVACLLFRGLRLLEVPAAFFGAALFALHPVCVESVAWISEQKNTLCAVFYLLAALSYFKFDRGRSGGAYARATAFFLLAILAKSVAATLPPALLVIFWWKRGRLAWRDLLPLGPWFFAGAAMGRLTAWVERVYVAGGDMGYHLAPAERVLIAGRAIWFYLGKLLWPSRLSFIYPRWSLSTANPLQWIAPLALLAVLAALWAMRGRSRAPLAGALLFVGTLLPALGVVDVFPFLYSFVADHFQYLAAMYALPAIAAGLALLVRKWALPAAGAGAAAAAVLFALAALTWRQSAEYRDSITLWRRTLALNPTCWMALNNLGSDLLAAGRVREAKASIRASLDLKPDNAAAHSNLADALHRAGDAAGAEAEYRTALHLDPTDIGARANYGTLLYDTGRVGEAIEQYRAALQARPDDELAQGDLGDALMAQGHLDEAIAAYRAALSEAPDDFRSETNYGTALMRLGRGPEAMAAYQAAVRLNPKYAIARLDLGNALLFSGRDAEAIASYQVAVALDPSLASAHNNFGYALLRAGRTAAALAQFSAELKVNPSVAAGNLGYAMLQAGRPDEALNYFRQALAQIPR